MVDVLEGGGGDRSGPTRWRRGRRLAAAGAVVATLGWYAFDTGVGRGGGADRAPGPALPGPPAAAGSPAPVDAIVSVAEGGFPGGTVLARIGPGDEEHVRALNGTLLDLPEGVDPCAVPTDAAGGRGILHKLWRAGSSHPAVRRPDLSGGPRPVAPFHQILGYRGGQVWTAEGSASGGHHTAVHVREGVGAESRPLRSVGDRADHGDRGEGRPVALLDSMSAPRQQPGPSVTGVVYADGADPTLPRPEGYDLRVAWPMGRVAAFHVDAVLGYGADTVVAVDRPCDAGECGLTVLQANRGTAVVRQGVTLPDGWVVPEPADTGRLAFTDDGFVLVVRTREGQHTALAYIAPSTGRAHIVPGSEGALLLGPKTVAADGPEVLFMVDGGPRGRARLAHWDSTTGDRARILSSTTVEKSDRLVCVVRGQEH